MGPLSLGDLPAGEFRFLTDREANALRELVETRQEAVERGDEQVVRPKRPVRQAGWAKPEKSKKFSSKKVRVV
jgi:23S rRNA pseudouridine2605 synthase